jgi:Protein of unknown function, DUF600
MGGRWGVFFKRICKLKNNKMEVNNIYLEIANCIVGSINAGWAKALLKIEIQEGVTGYNLAYYDNAEIRKSVRLIKTPNISEYIQELHAITTEGCHNRWNKLEFTLFPDGKFDLQFIWDQAWQDEIDGYNNMK